MRVKGRQDDGCAAPAVRMGRDFDFVLSATRPTFDREPAVGKPQDETAFLMGIGSSGLRIFPGPAQLAADLGVIDGAHG
jgi:hypothetical protein